MTPEIKLVVLDKRVAVVKNINFFLFPSFLKKIVTVSA